MPRPGYQLRVPRPVWSDAVRTLRQYGRLDSEGLVYLSGVVVGPRDVAVTGLLRVAHAPQGDGVHVTPVEMRWVLDTLRGRDEKLVAQMHSHRYGDHHSPGDDAWATSYHDGFLSIVVPRFGSGSAGPEAVGIYETRGGRFERLTAREVAERIRVVEPVVDRAALPTRMEPWWRRFAQNVKRIAPKLR